MKETAPFAKRMERQRIQEQTEAFLASGGTIRKFGVTSSVTGKSSFTSINKRKKAAEGAHA